MVGLLGCLGLMALPFVPAGWRPAWIGEGLAGTLALIGLIALEAGALLLRRDGDWAGIRPFERVGIAIVAVATLAYLADSALKVLGSDLLPQTYEGPVLSLAILGGFTVLTVRMAVRRLDEAKPRRHDIAMGE